MLPDISLWDVYAPIYRAMESCVDFDPLVVAFERVDITGDTTEQEVQSFFKANGIRGSYSSKAESNTPLSNYQPDVVFYTLGTAAYPSAYKIEFTSRYCLTCYLSYGFLLVNEPEYQFGQSFHHAAWVIFASTLREKNEYDTRTKRLSSNSVITGYPKFDLYPPVPTVAPKKPCVIWAPHWTIGLIYPALNLGTFADIYQDMAALMKDYSHVDFLIRPHPNLRYACQETTFMNNATYDKYMTDLAAMPNVSIMHDGNNVDKFITSSAMVTDSVSFLAEYLPSTRPLLFLDRKDRAFFSGAGESIIAAHYTGKTIGDIKGFIDEVVINRDDPKVSLRSSAMKHGLNIGANSATSKILGYLTRSLGLPKHTNNIDG